MRIAFLEIKKKIEKKIICAIFCEPKKKDRFETPYTRTDIKGRKFYFAYRNCSTPTTKTQYYVQVTLQNSRRS